MLLDSGKTIFRRVKLAKPIQRPVSVNVPPLFRQTLVTFQDFAHWEASGSVLLLIAVVIALVWANSPWAESYFHLWETQVGVVYGSQEFFLSLHAWVNDGLMAIFFFLVGLEIKRELMVGELSTFRKAMLPIAAAIGGMLFPGLIYTVINFGDPGQDGWAIPTATDIAFALGVLALLGRRVPVELKVFLTALAIADDMGAVLVIALFYTSELHYAGLVVAFILVAIIYVLGRLKFVNYFIYMLLAIGVWLAVHESGIHATVAGILVALVVPAKARLDPDKFFREGVDRLKELTHQEWTPQSMLTNTLQRESIQELNQAAQALEPPLMKLEHALHPYVAFFILPLFALSNAGVQFSQNFRSDLFSPVSLGVILGLVIGKQVGITLFSWLAVRLGLAQLPHGVQWRQIYGLGWLGGIGFTMSLFITELAFEETQLQDQAIMGILTASLIAGVCGYFILRQFLPSEAKSSG
jgi:NhaA family Na+:H+ antiporter